MFQITDNILKDTEVLLLKLPARNKIWKWTTRYLFFPYKFLKLGLADFFKPAFLWASCSFILMILIQKINLPIEYRETIFSISMFIPMALVIFSVPSTYAFNGIKKDQIDNVVGLLRKEGIETIKSIELVEENIKRIYDRINSRVSFYKWLVGAIWTMYILFFSIEMRVFLSFKSALNNTDLLNATLFFSIYFFSTLFAMLLIVGYKRASEILIKTIEYACTQNKYEIMKSNP